MLLDSVGTRLMFVCDAVDPFCHVSFLNVSQTTEVLEKTLCPTWDQTLIFDQVQIHGAPADIAKEPPEIVIEFFDQDVFVSICAYCTVILIIRLIAKC